MSFPFDVKNPSWTFVPVSAGGMKLGVGPNAVHVRFPCAVGELGRTHAALFSYDQSGFAGSVGVVTTAQRGTHVESTPETTGRIPGRGDGGGMACPVVHIWFLPVTLLGKTHDALFSYDQSGTDGSVGVVT